MLVQVLINTLADSKTTSSIIKERVEESEKTEVEIDLARKKYTPVATRGSIIYFVIADLSGIDPMYQYSLQYYQTLFDRFVMESTRTKYYAQRFSGCSLSGGEPLSFALRRSSMKMPFEARIVRDATR